MVTKINNVFSEQEFFILTQLIPTFFFDPTEAFLTSLLGMYLKKVK